MKVYAIGVGQSHFNAEELETKLKRLRGEPRFRRATRNILLAHLAIAEAMTESRCEPSQFSDSGFVLGSSYGEIESTKDFLKFWSQQNLARPMLFQGSLHSGTTGYLTLELAIKGPSFTVSRRALTGESALEMGMDLVQSQVVDLCVVVSVEAISVDLRPVLLAQNPYYRHWEDKAWAIILASDDYLKKSGLRAQAEMMSVSYETHARAAHPEKPFNDSDGLALVIDKIKNRNADQNESFIQMKSDGLASRIEMKVLNR